MIRNRLKRNVAKKTKCNGKKIKNSIYIKKYVQNQNKKTPEHLVNKYNK